MSSFDYDDDGDAYGAAGGFGGAWMAPSPSSDSGGSEGAAAAAGSARRRSARDNTLTPVTIRMLLDASYAAGAKDGANYKGMQLAQVSVVGMVRSQSARSAGVVLTLNDSSGEIDAVRYTSDAATADVNSEDELMQTDLTGQYVKVIGKVQSGATPFGSVAPRLHVLSLRALHPDRDDFNEITAHALSVIHNFLRVTAKPRQQEAVSAGDEYKLESSNSYQSSWQAGDGYGVGSSAAASAGPYAPQLPFEAAGYPSSYSSMQGNNGDERAAKRRAMGGPNMSFQQEQQRTSGRVLQVLNAMAGHPNNASEAGVCVTELTGLGLSDAELKNAIEVLAEQGQIYSTIDDFTFKTNA